MDLAFGKLERQLLFNLAIRPANRVEELNVAFLVSCEMRSFWLLNRRVRNRA
jgi:hypothetical protein